MYQLIYSEKSVSSGITSYVGFQGCVPRMEYALTNTPIVPDPQSSLSSQLLGCFSTKSFRNVCDLNSAKERFSELIPFFFLRAKSLVGDHHAQLEKQTVNGKDEYPGVVVGSCMVGISQEAYYCFYLEYSYSTYHTAVELE